MNREDREYGSEFDDYEETDEELEDEDYEGPEPVDAFDFTGKPAPGFDAFEEENDDEPSDDDDSEDDPDDADTDFSDPFDDDDDLDF